MTYTTTAKKKAKRHEVRIADQVWIATALLHYERTGSADFTVSEISEKVRELGFDEKVSRSAYQHAYYHAVANRPRETGAYRMLYATGALTRRLFREGDRQHPTRSGKIVPQRSDIPERYHYLLDWYQVVYAKGKTPTMPGILELRGLGKEIWEGIDPDQYVRELREGWE